MDTILAIIGWACLAGGSALCLIGAWGMIRLPDLYTRMHGASLIDTGGMGLILIGLMFQAGLSMVTVKLILILLFLFFTGPTTTHALARAAINSGLTPGLGEGEAVETAEITGRVEVEGEEPSQP